MCGRVALHDDKQFLEQVKKTIKEVEHNLTLQPSYNIAPSQPIATLTNDKVYQYTRFGLIPHWAKDSKFQPINARAETLAKNLRSNLPLNPTDALFPSTASMNGEKREIIKYPTGYPLRIQTISHLQASVIPGLILATNKEIISSAIITTIPNDMMKPIHDRMPVILEPKDWELWLDANIHESEALMPLLKPFDEKAMQAYEVSTFVNSPANNTAQCIEPKRNALF